MKISDPDKNELYFKLSRDGNSNNYFFSESQLWDYEKHIKNPQWIQQVTFKEIENKKAINSKKNIVLGKKQLVKSRNDILAHIRFNDLAVMHKIISMYGDEMLAKIPEKFQSKEMWNVAILAYGYSIGFVPEKYMTKDLCITAVKQNGQALGYVPDKYKTYDVCLTAATQHGGAIQFVPEEHKTFELCLVAVLNYSDAIIWVPEKHKTYELCLAAVTTMGVALRDVPDKHKTLELCKVAVTNYGWAIKDVPDKYKTYELCLLAVSNTGFALEYIPEKHKTYELCLKAVTPFYNMLKQNDPQTIEDLRYISGFIPDKLKSKIADVLTKKVD